LDLSAFNPESLRILQAGTTMPQTHIQAKLVWVGKFSQSQHVASNQLRVWWDNPPKDSGLQSLLMSLGEVD